jgi:hypothetical protein
MLCDSQTEQQLLKLGAWDCSASAMPERPIPSSFNAPEPSVV